jgi:hypothetical protein
MSSNLSFSALQLSDLSNDYCGTKSSRLLFEVLQEIGKFKHSLKPSSCVQLSGPILPHEGNDWEQYFNVNFSVNPGEAGIFRLRFSELDIFDHAFEDFQIRRERCKQSGIKLLERLAKFNVIKYQDSSFAIPVFQEADSYHFMIAVLNEYCASELVPMTMAGSTSFKSLARSDEYSNSLVTLQLLRSIGEFNGAIFNSNLVLLCNVRVGVTWTPTHIRLVYTDEGRFVLIIEYIEAGMSESHYRKVKSYSHDSSHFCEFGYPESINIHLHVDSADHLKSQIGTILNLLT